MNRCRSALMWALGVAWLSAPWAEAAQSAPKSRPSGRSAGVKADAEAAWAACLRSLKAQDGLALPRLLKANRLSRLLPSPVLFEDHLAELDRFSARDPLFQAQLRQIRSTLDRNQGDLKSAEARLSGLGLIFDGMLIGPFDNAAGRGVSTPYAPETAPDIAQRPSGHVGKLSWQAVHTPRSYGRFELSEMLYPSQNGTAYLAFRVDAPKAMRAALRLTAEEQVQVFVNHRSVFQSPTGPLGIRMDQAAVPIHLERGINLVMLKVSWQEYGSIMARITDPKGRAIPGLRFPSEAKAIAEAMGRPKARASKAWRGLRRPGDALKRRLKRARGRARAELLTLQAEMTLQLGSYDAQKRPTAWERDLAEAIQLDPTRIDTTWLQIDGISRLSPGRAKDAQARLLKLAPRHAPTLHLLAQNARQAGEIPRARRLDEAAIQSDPDFLRARAARVELGFTELGEGPRAFRWFDGIRGLREAPMALRLLAQRAEWAQKPKEAWQILEAALERSHDDDSMWALIERIATERFDSEALLKLLTRQVAQKPWQLEPRLKLLRALAGMPDDPSNRFQRLFTETAIAFPRHPAVATLAAEMALWDQNPDAALVAFDRALQQDPLSTQIRERRGELSGRQNELEDRYSLNPMTLLEAPISEAEKSSGAVMLEDRDITELYENGNYARFGQQIFRLHKDAVNAQLRVHRLFYSPSRERLEVLSAQRITPSGAIIPASQVSDVGPSGKVNGMYIDQRMKEIVFDELEGGDLVHLRFRVDSVGENLLGGFFGDVKPLQSHLPKAHLYYQVSAPNGVELSDAELRAPAPKREIQGDQRALIWDLKAIPALWVEPRSPPYTELGMMISLSNYRSWQDLSHWYAKLYSPELKLDAEARAAGDAAVLGATSQEDRVRRLFNYVVQNTRYVGIELGIHGWKPYNASEVHRRRYGDCKDKSSLLVALLRAQGIEAALTLVRTKDRGPFPPGSASMWAFNHAIVYVPSLDRFLDPTAEYSNYKDLPAGDQGALALVVYTHGQHELRTLPVSRPEDNVNSATYEVRVDPHTRLHVEGEERFIGAGSAQFRAQLEPVAERKRWLTQYLNPQFPGVELKSVQTSKLTDLDAPIKVQVQFEVPRWGQQSGGLFRMRAALFEHRLVEQYASLPSRHTDLLFDFPSVVENRVRYTLPKGARILELPSTVRIDTPHLSFTQELTPIPGGFLSVDTLRIPQPRVPAKDYPAFKKACLNVDRALARKVVIQW